MADASLIQYDEVAFQGGAIPSALVNKGGKQVIVVHPKSTCERLGISWPTQYRNITDHPVWAKGIVMMTTPLSSGNDTVMLELRFWLLWLANIDPRRVNEEAAPVLMDYQERAADVLEAHFLKNQGHAPQTNAEMLVLLAQQLVDNERRQKAIEEEQRRLAAGQEQQQQTLTVLGHRVNTLDAVNVEGDHRQRLDAMMAKYDRDHGLKYGQGWHAFDQAYNTAFHTNLTALRRNYAKKKGHKALPTRPEYLEAVGQLPDAMRIADKLLNPGTHQATIGGDV